MKAYITFILLCLGGSTYSQPGDLTVRREVDFRKHILYVKVIGKVEMSAINYYPDEDFTSGSILIGEDMVSKPLMMRYNRLHDVVEIKSGIEIFEIRPDGFCCDVKIGDIHFVSRQSVEDGVARTAFYEVLESGFTTLLKKEKYRHPVRALSEEKIARPVTSHYVTAGNQYLKVATQSPTVSSNDFETHFYYEDSYATLNEINSVRKFINSLPNNQKKLRQFASENKLLKNQQDLVQLVVYFNSLENN